MSAPPCKSTLTIFKSPREAAAVKAVSPSFSSFALGLIPAARNPLTAISSPAAAAERKDCSSKLYPRSLRNFCAASGVGLSLPPSTQPARHNAPRTRIVNPVLVSGHRHIISGLLFLTLGNISMFDSHRHDWFFVLRWSAI